MTKYQIVATKPSGVTINVGDPYEFMTMAEAHAMELRDMLRFVSNPDEITLTVKPVESEKGA